MFHSFKKRFAKATAPLRGVNAGGEFLDLKGRLLTLRKTLQYIDRELDSAVQTRNNQIIQQRGFSERFARGYPLRGDDTDGLAKEFAAGAQGVYDHFLRGDAVEADGPQRMHANVKEYLRELAAVEGMYSGLATHASEAARYQGKVDALDRRGKSDDLKRSRNLQKMDHERLVLEEALKETVAAQKKAYAKAPTVFKAALCAYWAGHEGHKEVVEHKMQKMTAFVRSEGVELGQLDLGQIVLEAGTQEAGKAGSVDNGSVASGEMSAASDETPMETLGARVPSVVPEMPRVRVANKMEVESIGDDEDMISAAVAMPA